MSDWFTKSRYPCLFVNGGSYHVQDLNCFDVEDVVNMGTTNLRHYNVAVAIIRCVQLIF